jgi:hypothetical protein
MSDINFNPEETVIELKFPIERNLNGVTSLIHELKLQRFKFKHIKLLPIGIIGGNKKKISVSEAAQLGPLIAALSGLTEAEAGEIDFIDLLKVVEKLGDVLGK